MDGEQKQRQRVKEESLPWEVCCRLRGFPAPAELPRLT